MYVLLAYNDSAKDYYGPSVPSCASLTRTLIVTLVSLHILGMTSMALALVTLVGACTQKTGGALLLWEMALAPLPGYEDDEGNEPSSYGATSGTHSSATESASSAAETARPRQRDKFDNGRLWCYIPLLLFSLAAIACAATVIAIGELRESLLASTDSSWCITPRHLSRRGQCALCDLLVSYTLHALTQHRNTRTTTKQHRAQDRSLPSSHTLCPLAMLRDRTSYLPRHIAAPVPQPHRLWRDRARHRSRQRRSMGSNAGVEMEQHAASGRVRRGHGHILLARGVDVVLPDRGAHVPYAGCGCDAA